METATFAMVHVGQSTVHQRNLQHGIETRSWGFPIRKPWFEQVKPDFAVLVTGTNPRQQLNDWVQKMVDMYLFAVQVPVYEGQAPHWPDELATGNIIYPFRMGLEPLGVIENASLGEDGPLTLAASDAARHSGLERGVGWLVDMDPQPLLDLAKIPVNWAETGRVPLNRAPGFTAEAVKGVKVPKRQQRGAGWMSDPKKRKAVEMHAEDWAVRLYESEGWDVERIGKPYDLRCTRKSGEERRVEVKGTTGAPTSVELTINEIEHARAVENTVDLFVVSDIKVTPEYVASGGVPLHLKDWEPSEEDLRPRKFEYRLPQAGT
ncbi:DUF3883 domain-containing protein [Streptomyces sp. ok210]|uniref:DUF3883 domain-containing protein n=1 Tax=Streptomyces sp. ok210 TaxID=1761905 RepID=UPI0008E0B9D4|nr:DUF3883 domain-containing protein [Streptomyces sp. ok210]SFS73109.1 protein of unknown function [Streptomyces sp. ok210]